MHTKVLDNGLRVVVHPRSVGLAAVYLWIDAGSIDERPGEHGAAHFLEHMLFKGTARRGVGAHATAIEDLGGDLNAFTTTDTTVLHATVESEGWAKALDVIVDMARYSAIDPEETERERHVVLEEIRGYASDPEELLSDAMAAAQFPDHPYGRPIVGTADEVLALPRQALVDFWTREWGADRAVLSIAGDVDPQAVFAEAERLLGDWPAAAPRASRPIATPIMGPLTVMVPDAERGSRLVHLSWPTVPLGHPDAPIADVLALVLGDGPGATVPERLADDGLIADPWGSTSTRPDAGVLTLGFMPREGKSEQAIERFLAELKNLQLEGISEDAVERSRAGVVSDFVFAAETVDGVAYEDAWHWAQYGDPAASQAQHEAYRRVTAADVTRALRTWIVPEHLVVGTHDRSLGPDRTRDAVAAGANSVPTPPFQDVDVVLDNGIRLIVRPDGGEGEVVAITAALRGGQLAMPERGWGIAEAWGRMITAGADGMSAGRFSASLDRTGGMAWGAGGRSTLQLHGRFPRETALEGLSLVLMALATPEWDADAWDREQAELLHDLETTDESAGRVAANALWQAVWPRHPWERPPEGTLGTVQRMTPDKLADWHDHVLRGEDLVITVVGPVPATRARHLVEEWLGDVPRKGRRLRVPKVARPTRARTLHRTALAEQAHVVIGARGLALDDADRPASRVLAAILGAQGGRLFLDLRERRSLAYSVWADGVEAWTGGLFEAGLACHPDRVAEATESLHAALDQTVLFPPDAEELQRAIRVLRGSRATALQRAGGRAVRIATSALFGLPLDPRAADAAWAKVSPDDVQRVATRLMGRARITVKVEPRP